MKDTLIMILKVCEASLGVLVSSLLMVN